MCWISQSAAPLPLGFGDLLAVNILMQATSLGYLAALFRDWFAPIHGMVSRLAYPVVTDWVALLVLGALLQRLTQLNERSDGTRMDRLSCSGCSGLVGLCFCAHMGSYCLHFISFALNKGLSRFCRGGVGVLACVPRGDRVRSLAPGAVDGCGRLCRPERVAWLVGQSPLGRRDAAFIVGCAHQPCGCADRVGARCLARVLQLDPCGGGRSAHRSLGRNA